MSAQIPYEQVCEIVEELKGLATVQFPVADCGKQARLWELIGKLEALDLPGQTPHRLIQLREYFHDLETSSDKYRSDSDIVSSISETLWRIKETVLTFAGAAENKDDNGSGGAEGHNP